jgi:pimeloyl-ACP methyl ester carboxylesterase
MDHLLVEAAPGVSLTVDLWPGPHQGFLLVHGLASNARLWDGVAGRLFELGYAVAALDQRGHGRSSKPGTGYDFPAVCNDLVAVIDALAKRGSSWERPVVVGQSWGANVALELGWRQPGLLSGVALVDGGVNDLASRFPTWESCRQALAPPHLTGLQARDFEASIRRLHPDWKDWAVRATLANVKVDADGTIAPWLSLERHLQILEALYHHRPRQHFPEMQVPVLLAPADTGEEIWTKEKRAGVEEAEATIPDVRVRWFAPADHDIHLQHPNELAEVLHEAVVEGFFA